MTSQLLWTLIAIQVGMGAFDTLYHHEMTEPAAQLKSLLPEGLAMGVDRLPRGD